MNGYSIDEGEMYNRKKDPKKKDPIRTTNPSPANVGGYKKNYKNSGKEQSCKNGNALYSSDQNKPKKYKEGERFVNPYNFIPFEGQCKRESLEGNKDIGYMGYFDCSLRLLTHLFIPNTSSYKSLTNVEDVKKAKKDSKDYVVKGYDFFSYDDLSGIGPYTDQPPLPPRNPVIPGSEIRGAVRSVYEAAFNGCMSSVDGERDISRRVIEVKQPGILKKEPAGWFLRPCTKVRLRVEQEEEQRENQEKGKVSDKRGMVKRAVYNTWKEGKEIWVKTGKNKVVVQYKPYSPDLREAKGFKKGYLHKGEYIEKKKYEAVFLEDQEGGRKGIRVSDKDVELLQILLNEYRNEKKNRKAKDGKWYNEYEVLETGTLVYYTKTEGGRLYLSPACIGKEMFTKKINTILKNNGEYQPCIGEKLCSACQIFGMLDKTEQPKTFAYGSKVRITDAKLVSPPTNIKELFEDPLVLPELGEPRPSAVEFYTQSPSPESDDCQIEQDKGYWTYDYKYLKDGKKTKRVVLDDFQPKIRGRKYYWHHDVRIEDYKKDNSLNAMRQRIRPMKPSDNLESVPIFQFRVYFESLSKKQLNQLKWALDFGNPDCAHKIGRAKPLGFGSVRVNVDELHIRKIDETTGRWYMMDIGANGNESFEKFFEDSLVNMDRVPQALKVMANWKNRPDNVRYPFGEDESGAVRGKENASGSHQWFTINKGENELHHNFIKVLPKAEEEIDKNLCREKALYDLTRKRK
ncbi:TIGR03986 family type III CRISPR-associated RAMP protein [Faecalicatena orotica]|uniref:TIGR03986 family type III CRISPR-associated RAMP protein n=1 Tax=Faecalicatena orotica TaxID=1544 RepID=UPI003217CE87